MKKLVQKIPFLRPTISLAFGIFIGSFEGFSVTMLILLSIALLLILFYLNQTYKYYLAKWFGFFIQFLFILIGILVFETYNKKPIFFEDGIYIATVSEKPQKKQNSFKSLITVSKVKQKDTVFLTNENILVYFEKEGPAKELGPGDQIIFTTSPQFIKNDGNPFEFDYKKYLANKKIYRQLYLSSKNWKTTNFQTHFSLTIYAEQIREKLLSVYRKQNIGKNELEILSALTLGYKRELDPETKRIFSASGAMHVLAVSGLHVGIVFWMITLLFGFLRKQKSGKIIFTIISILSLWSYAFITGLSPSVMRASTMFTIFVIGDNLNRKANTYNSLAASALLLLLFNPNNLFEVGFQLSYSAVFGIVFLQPKLSKLIRAKNKILKYFWSLLTISVAAQIATFPLISFYFNQFPSYFWLTNLIIIPVVMILIPLGLALLLFSKITIFSTFLSFLLNLIIKLSYIILSKIEQLPYSVQEISIHPFEFLFLIGILFSIYLLAQNFKPRNLKIALSFTLFLLISSLIININQARNREIIVYNLPQNITIQLISGKINYVVSEHKIASDKNTFKLIHRTNLKLKLNPPIFLTKEDILNDDFLLSKNGIIIFEGKKILFQNNIQEMPETISPNLIIDPKRLNEFENPSSKNVVIITERRYIQNKNQTLNPIYFTLKQGAFIEKW
ncbi:MAG: ComEC family competence protein [Draconibacterium sp.]|nr:ComEC family competence protein [Draconibacterium sp.]